jgi:hypothetical protein
LGTEEPPLFSLLFVLGATNPWLYAFGDIRRSDVSIFG